MPFTVVQLTDLHIGAPWSKDPSGALAAAVDGVARTLTSPQDAVVVSGDIANTPTDAEYEQARLLDRLGAPVYAVPGNHDDRDGLRRHFDFPSTDRDLPSYDANLGPVRLVVLDTKRSGSDAGQLDDGRLRWLERALAEDRLTPTLLVMHHLPLASGIPAMDEIGISDGERRALAELLAHHQQVQLIATGHVHRTIVGTLGATMVLAIPSTDMQLALDFEAPEIRLVPEPPCFAIHVLIDGRLISHVQPLTTAPH